MKKESSGDLSPNEAGALYCMSGSNYVSKGKRIKVLYHPGVPLVGLMLLAILPFGASIKQSLPRVKLSHRGKKFNICLSFLFLLHIYIYFDALMCLGWSEIKIKFWKVNEWAHFGYFSSCQQPSSFVHIAGITPMITLYYYYYYLLFFCPFHHFFLLVIWLFNIHLLRPCLALCLWHFFSICLFSCDFVHTAKN